MTKLNLGIVIFALAILTCQSSVEAQCAYSGGQSYYSPSYSYSPAVGYGNSSYAPSYGYGSNYYVPSNQYRSGNYGWDYTDIRRQRIRRVATVALVAGVIVAASNGNNRNRYRRNRW